MGVWYRAGTVAVTAGSKTVTGTGTQWQNLIFGVAPGTTFYGPDGKPYEIDTVNSNTSLTLATNYSGSTASGQAYAVDPTRSGSVASLAAQTSEVLKFSQGQFTQIQNWFTGAASANVTLTSPAGQQVTVPSYLKVTSEGEGQAARAKTEADKAAASAALAGDIVAASALPLPDAWAPLSDSLRMITGYGRDVLVGSDVVARMVNFSRNSTATYIGKDGQLKTAAANEPRFEKEGLLLEGQSTNLIARSEGISMSNPGGSSTVVQNNIADFLPGFLCVRVTFNNPTISNGDHIRISPSVQAGKTYTWSIVTDSPDRRVFSYSYVPGAIQNSVFSVTKISERLWRQANTFTVSSAFVPGTDYLDVRIVTSTRVAGDVINAGAIQLEELPFASSYIPTNGALVTRAADKAWIPAENGGLPGMDNEKTMSLTSNILGVNGPFNFILATPWGAIDYTLTHERISGSLLALAMNTPVALKTSVRKVARFTKGGGCAAIFGDIQKTGPTANWSLSTSRIVIGSMTESGANPHFGHVKDLKIWLKPLSDAQMKAIA